jgi:hypothetical protein
VVWCVPWFLSACWAAIGLAVVGYGDIGACISLSSSIPTGTDTNKGAGSRPIKFGSSSTSYLAGS